MAMPSISARMQELSLQEPVQANTSSPPDDAQSLPRPRSPPATNPVQVNPRPLPTVEECRAARRRCMYYGFYAGELAIQKMLINSFPEQLGGRDPFDPGFFITGLDYVRRVTKRRDIGVHIAWVSKRNKEMVPSIGLDVGEATFIIGLFALAEGPYRNRITQEKVDLLAEMFGTKPTWWEIAQLTDL